MIRTLVVDDDLMTASIHRAYVERVGGFEVVGEAHTGADAIEQIRRVHPDLVLLDIYMPDMTGLDVLRRLRAGDLPRVDVIAVTAAKDVATLRSAIHGGVVQYLVKPFFFDALKERLEAYAALRGRLDRLRNPDQEDIDRVFALVRGPSRRSLPKGISGPTLSAVIEALKRAPEPSSAVDVADAAGVSRGTSRRYLEYLVANGAAELSLRYGVTGRPEHLYRWAGPEPAPPEGDAGSDHGG